MAKCNFENKDYEMKKNIKKAYDLDKNNLDILLAKIKIWNYL